MNSNSCPVNIIGMCVRSWSTTWQNCTVERYGYEQVALRLALVVCDDSNGVLPSTGESFYPSAAGRETEMLLALTSISKKRKFGNISENTHRTSGDINARCTHGYRNSEPFRANFFLTTT